MNDENKPFASQESSSNSAWPLEELRKALDHEKRLKIKANTPASFNPKSDLSAVASPCPSEAFSKDGAKSEIRNPQSAINRPLNVENHSRDEKNDHFRQNGKKNINKAVSACRAICERISKTQFANYWFFNTGFPIKIKPGFEQRGGFECGASGAKLVLLTFNKSDVCVEKAFIEEESFELRINNNSRPQSEIVRRLLIQRNLIGCKVVFVNDEASGSCFVMTPKMDKADADGAVLLQSRKLLSWESTEPVMARLDSEFLRDRTGSIVGLADWPGMKPWSQLIEASGGMLDDITIRACAYKTLSDYQNLTDEHPVILIADFGATTSCFYILDHQVVKFMREVPIGGDAITKALTTEVSTDTGPIRLSSVDAEQFKIRGDLAKVSMVVRPVIERMASETLRSIQFFEENSGQKVNAIYVTGGSSSLSMLNEHLATSISIPIKNLDPLSKLSFSNTNVKNYAEKHKARLPVAVGLALAKQPAISLLPNPTQVIKRLAKYAPIAVLILFLAGFIPMILIGMIQEIKIRRILPKIEIYEEKLSKSDPQTDQLATVQTELRKTTEYHQALQLLITRKPLWPGVLNALAEAVPDDIVINSFSNDLNKKGGLVLIGHVLPSADSFDNTVASFLSALGSSVFFSHVSLVNADVSRNGKILGTFKIQCELVY
ncbi:pilus assembly protein PilM [Verrucomicrobiota bacterium]